MKFRIIGALLLGIPAAMPAAAADLGHGVSLSGGASIVSDYRFRGISLSDEDPAVQGSLELGHESGLYAGIWGSSLDDTPLYGKAELDLYGGWRHDLAPGTSLDLGFTYYWYPDGENKAGASDVIEPKVALTHAFGPVSATVGAAWAPSQASTGQKDNLYLWSGLSAAIPGTPVTLKAQAGRSDGALAPGGDYWDWSVGAEAAVGRVKLGLTYVDTDLGSGHNVDPTLVASVGFTF